MFKEGYKVELKEKYTQDLKKEVIAFINCDGGTIYEGIADSGEVVGINDVDEVMLAITNLLRDNILPDAMMFIRVESLVEENKDIIKVTVEEGTRKPYYLKDKGMKSSGVYVRQGTSSAPASQDAIRQMIKLTDGDSFENSRSIEQNLHFNTMNEEMKKRNLEFGQVQMHNLGFINNDEMYTNLALLTSDECIHSIKLAVFQGNDKSVFIDRKEFKGSIFKQLNDAYATLELYNRTSASFDGLLRIDQKDYPELSLREALLNAIVHRDYSYSGDTFINVYSNKIEIVSLGGLVSGMSIEAILLGASQARNEKLAALFYRMQLIESYGIGVGKIMSSYNKCINKPVFENADGAFRVTLPNMNNDTIGLSKTHNLVVEYLKNNKYITRPSIEELLDVKVTRANSIIGEMLKLGIIVKVGNGKNTKYMLADQL